MTEFYRTLGRLFIYNQPCGVLDERGELPNLVDMAPPLTFAGSAHVCPYSGNLLSRQDANA